MKQESLFGEEFEKKIDSQYTSKITTPIYEPKNKKPYPIELYDDSKAKRLINEINNTDLDNDVKKFLILSAYRHTVFNYSKIADFYAHSDKKIQSLIEKSALVIIDFNKAYEHGFVLLANELANIYLDTYEK